VVSTQVKGRNLLQRIADACAERAMELRVIVSAAMTGRLAHRYPETACKNAFKDASQISVCLANPDVQTYLCGLASDLSSNYRLTGLTITDCVLAWCEAFTADQAMPWLGLTEAALLSTCFCESCQQRASAAGVDVGMARRSVETLVQKSLDRGAESGQHLDSILADNAPLAAYDHWRRKELSDLLKRLTECCTCELLLDRRLDRADRHQQKALDPDVPAAVITRLENPEELQPGVLPEARRYELRIPETLVVGSHASDLVRTLSHAAELGFTGVEIDNYGLLPETALTPIKQAIRFARRAASED
jgi:AraC-like DNA-binding protein